MSELISLAAAAERLETNSGVVQRMIQEGQIEATDTPKGQQVSTDSIERYLADLRMWLCDEEPDEDGIIRVSVKQMENFWKQRRSP